VASWGCWFTPLSRSWWAATSGRTATERRVAFYARFTGHAFTGTAFPPTLEGKCGSGCLAEKPGPHDADDWCGPSLFEPAWGADSGAKGSKLDSRRPALLTIVRSDGASSLEVASTSHEASYRAGRCGHQSARDGQDVRCHAGFVAA
jgi:hypothetical protein